ncbi:membrane peptidoglycan carboxypeptidase [Allocatelliglobosispora scoriae]|uniref:Membrane peptidoglycan carboxypeptidase n=1 Tax=Allocatelliglobosispora scoriae TaxID=643052 RepID=A0A841BTA2_9ACTN|nr:transglycosylase domain-containing protein [Allocatelliglobosispora scoriae]MBB5870648.1 membrane peptidoglycan carboxypeptidase [Allocatelliglobosispora scoriae]
MANGPGQQTFGPDDHSEQPREAFGRAGVPVRPEPGGGSSPVGRARVRPVMPDDDAPPQPEPARTGRRPTAKALKSVKGWSKRRKILLSSFAALLIMMGVGAIVFTYYFDSVDGITPDKLPKSQITRIMASDGKQIAQLGTENRIDIDVAQLDKKVIHALIAGEDKDFFEHQGISYTGIARAAFNNSTGGERQGGSTLTQQYVKQATQNMEMSVSRKLREAVLARKLEDNYSKDQILGFYLNTVWFGRGATGVEKAAQAYFGKSAAKLTYEEAAVLGAVIRTPEPDYLADGTIDPNGNKGLDPEINPEAAKDRWGYVLNNMVEKKWLDQGERATAAYPKLIPRAQGTTSAEWGIKGSGTGNVINYVYDELNKMGIKRSDLKTGGYRVTTTIDSRMQTIAEAQIRKQLKLGKPNLMSALVATDPATGRVLAYYGGDDGTGHDYAGLNFEGGKPTGGHSPGSTMKVYTLAAALTDNISLKSTWDAREIKKVDATHPYTVKNAGRKDSEVARYCTPTDCSLETALVRSFNVPFFYVTQEIGPDKVIKTAQAAGINYLWDNDSVGYKLADQKGDWGRKPFDYPVGYGQYGITVLDHATGMATFANAGVYNTPHFVLKVEQHQLDGSYRVLPQFNEKLAPEKRIDAEVANEVAATMQEVVPTHNGWALDGGRDSAAKTGTWERGKTADNAHAWVVGFTKQIAVAVWVGNKGDELALKYANGDQINSGNMPGDIWHNFLNEASKGMPKLALPDETGTVGSDSRGNGVAPPSPSVSPSVEPSTSSSPEPEPEPSKSPSPLPIPSPSPSKPKIILPTKLPFAP